MIEILKKIVFKILKGDMIMKKGNIKKIGAFALALVLATTAMFITSCSSDSDKDSGSAETQEETSNS